MSRHSVERCTGPVRASLASNLGQCLSLPSRGRLLVARLPHEAVTLPRSVGPYRVDHVLVSGGHGSGRPPHETHDGPLGNTEDQQNCRGRVARVVQTPRPTSRRSRRDLVVEVSGLLRRFSGQYPALRPHGSRIPAEMPAAYWPDHPERAGRTTGRGAGRLSRQPRQLRQRPVRSPDQRSGGHRRDAIPATSTDSTSSDPRGAQ